MQVRVTQDGPYVVTGGVPLFRMSIGIDRRGESASWRRGRRYPLLPTYRLCRCGRSATPPFCDGSHAAGFRGTETASRRAYDEIARRLKGPGMVLQDAPELCASARFCLRAGGVWFLVRRSARPAARRTAIAETVACPAGRLVARRRDNRAIEPRIRPAIAVVTDPLADGRGPLWVRGGLRVVSARGFDWETRNRVTLCRCGRSANKPFCDGSHVLH